MIRQFTLYEYWWSFYCELPLMWIQQHADELRFMLWQFHRSRWNSAVGRKQKVLLRSDPSGSCGFVMTRLAAGTSNCRHMKRSSDKSIPRNWITSAKIIRKPKKRWIMILIYDFVSIEWNLIKSSSYFYEIAQKALHRIKHKLQYYVVAFVSFVSFHIMSMDVYGCIWMYFDVINGGGMR